MNMKIARNMTFSLNGLGSVLDIYPDSDLDAEMAKLYEMTEQLAEKFAESSHSHYVTVAVSPKTSLSSLLAFRRDYECVALCQVDRDALADDWLTVGGDFLNAYQQARTSQQKPIRKGKAECGKP